MPVAVAVAGHLFGQHGRFCAARDVLGDVRLAGCQGGGESGLPGWEAGPFDRLQVHIKMGFAHHQPGGVVCVADSPARGVIILRRRRIG